MNNLFMQRYKELGQEFDPEQVQMRPALRINTKKSSEADVLRRLEAQGVKLEKISYLPNAYWYEAPFSLASTIEYLSGQIYLQEAASQVPVAALLAALERDGSLAEKATLLIADMCAAPGSKTTQLALALGKRATVYAFDTNEQRLKSLVYNLERQAVDNVIAIKKETQYLKDMGRAFDVILLDAPCSGNFCIDRDFFQKRSLHDVNSRVSIQKSLFKAAYACLARGGLMVYSTCSLEPEEGELLIDWALEEFSDLRLLPIDLDAGDAGLTRVFGQELDGALKDTRRFWPHKTTTEGFFIALLKKDL